ncbi:shikimate dehydrogenase family protein [Fluviicola taffensis]|uniref:Shikimate dehydrogenase n=1 Tax=Fluviicola taffensis (strain DSM 16823 / NCIMB 13979 / RW262) TaxID=755732 RepID=F2IBX3_FLUTR|nr:shikimate dehydrogenase [Fluviicola taffensis]AEA42201.1 Shikimate dehydrogenase [Fluviicola taffensis DSM 16823]
MSKFGLVGKTLGHSFSKSYFEDKFKNEGLEYTFENFELPVINDVSSVFSIDDLKGLSVTIPYKETIIPYLDSLSEEAVAIGAVNCISFQNGMKIGHNTDAFGFHQMIKPFLTNEHERALILGTGGASKAIAYVLRNIGLDVLWISRNPQKEKEFSYEAINEHMLNACKVIINCTPVGTFPDVNECVPFPFEFLTDKHLCIDLIYNPEETKFLTQSKSHGATILNGLSMLKEQANKAWEIWNN